MPNSQMIDIGTDNTTGRHFRQLVRKILWFFVDFFLTSFPRPTILRNQTGGKLIRWRLTSWHRSTEQRAR